MPYTPETQFLLGTSLTVDALLEEWHSLKAELDAKRSREMMLRKAICEIKFSGLADGTHRVELGNGYQLKVVLKTDYKCANKEGETEKALEEIAKLGNEGSFVADRLVRWTPELSQTEYKQLAPQYKAVIDRVITSKPGAPTLEIEAPKASK